MNSAPVELSVVIPAFNESRRIARSLHRISDYLSDLGRSAELVIVDDGSTDGTFDTVRSLAENAAVPVRAVRYARNRGKGFALKVGFEQATGDRILFSDADLSVSIEHADKLLAALDAGCDVAIGSRWVAGADIAVHQPWYREAMGKVFTLLVRMLISEVSDSTCGFKAFRGKAGRDLFARLRVFDWSFDAEILWLVGDLGYSLSEVPVRWEHEPATKVRLARDAAASLLGLARIRWNALRGAYRRPNPVDPPLEIWQSRPRAVDAAAADRAGGGR